MNRVLFICTRNSARSQEVNILRSVLWVSKELWKRVIPRFFRVALLFFVPLLLVIFPVSPRAEGKEATILLLHTNNVTGHFYPCPT
jgi:hypothetical protein